MPGLFAELYRSSLCHMVQKLQAFMSVANLGTHTLVVLWQNMIDVAFCTWNILGMSLASARMTSPCVTDRTWKTLLKWERTIFVNSNITTLVHAIWWLFCVNVKCRNAQKTYLRSSISVASAFCLSASEWKKMIFFEETVTKIFFHPCLRMFCLEGIWSHPSRLGAISTPPTMTPPPPSMEGGSPELHPSPPRPELRLAASTLIWASLIWSCSSSDSCKDKQFINCLNHLGIAKWIWINN